MNSYDVDLERGPVRLVGRYNGYSKKGRYNAFTYDKLYDVPVTRNIYTGKRKKSFLAKLQELKDNCCQNCNIQ